MFRNLVRPSFVAAAVIAGVAFVAACGDDDGDAGAGAATTTTQARAVAFSSSPEDGLPTAYPPPKPAPLTIGILSPTGGTEVLNVVWDAAAAEIKRLGGEMVLLHAELNPDTQVSQFEQLINRKVDAIVITPIAGPNVIGPLLQKAAAAKIPVIAALDVSPGKPIAVPGFASQIWHRRDRSTYLQVKAVADALPAGSEVAQIGLAVPVPLFQYTAQRQRYWAEKFGLNVVEKVDSKNDTTTGGEQAASGLIAKHPDLKAILGYNDEPAIGAALAARAAGRQDLKTYGITGGSLGRGAIKNGRLTASVFFDAVDVGTLAVQGAYDAAQGTKIPPVVLAGDPFIITKDNADDPPPTGGAPDEG